ncbi:MAG TPA: ATP-binding cassette domain-containing protein, partial [Miltoncostaeaceae bacterium]|nr:ATP-binding cassette domain-containing protein [Miltoncostaeaceae bacterium]
MSCAIDARGVTHRYPDGHLALDGIDLHVEHGERVAVLGPNGAGKTTFMLHLNGLLTASSGELEVAGLVVEPRVLQELRARVGLVFQDPDDQLFMPTVREDVAFGPLNQGLEPDEVLARVAGALGAVRMTHAADRAP